MLQFLLNRLREPSSWRGVILLLTALGVHIRPELGEAIIALGMALAGGVAVVTPDAGVQRQSAAVPDDSAPDQPQAGRNVLDL